MKKQRPESNSSRCSLSEKKGFPAARYFFERASAHFLVFLLKYM
jgi:hypothetical protein